MNKSHLMLFRYCLAGVVAALYAVLTLILPMLSYGPIQIRFSEALTVMPFLFPETIPGLTVGCFLANLIGSPYPLDMVFGTLATLLAAIWTAKTNKRWLAPMPPVIMNAVIIGAEIAITSTSFGTKGFWLAWIWNGITVGFGELIACYALGLPLLHILPKIPVLNSILRLK